MLAVARCRRLPGTEWWRAFRNFELPLWTLYARGGGGATKRAAASWLRGRAPWKAEKPEDLHAYFDAGGNGAAMRVLPHAVYFACDQEPNRLLHDVALDAVATHGHPRAIVGALVYAYAAWLLLRTQETVKFGDLLEHVVRGKKHWSALPTSDNGGGWMAAANQTYDGSAAQVWNKSVAEMSLLLDLVRRGLEQGALANDAEVLERLGCFGPEKGAGTISAAAALYGCARYAAQPTQAVLAMAFARGADTDTLAALSGGLVGSLAGNEWLPAEWTLVQDNIYIRELAHSLATFGSTNTQSESPALMNARDVAEIESSLWNGTNTQRLGPVRGVCSLK